MKKGTTLMALALSAALSLTMAPAMALAEPPETIRTIQWLSTDAQPEFPQTITVDGIAYQLASSQVKTVDTQYGQVPASRSRTVSCWPADLETTRGSFPNTVEVDEDGYRGTLPLTSVSADPVQVVRQWEVNETRAYSGLTSNDVDQIPASVEVAGPDTGNALTLRLASLSWTVDATDANGLPARYTANAIYRGADEGPVLDHYDVTAVYDGTLDATEPVLTYEATLTYLGPDGDAVGLMPVSEPEEEPDNNGLLAVAAAALAAAVAAGGVFFWYRGRDVRVCRVEGEALKVVAKVRSKRAQDGTLLVELPASLDVSPGQVALMLAPHKADGGALKVTQCGNLVATTRATSIVRL